jgi:hypothetical protein
VKNQDPLALAVFAAALALLAGLVLYVIFGASRAPNTASNEPAPATTAGSPFVERLKRELRGMAEEIRRDLPGGGGNPARPAPPPQEPQAPQAKARPQPAPPAAAKGAPQAAPKSAATATARALVQSGHVWKYTVQVQPPVWRNITLDYRTRAENGGTAVLTDFVHAGGKTNFHLGIFAPGHATHANTRFPGFFMHASYFPAQLAPGQALSWSWPWQGAGAGRIKRFDARVLRWENVQVPAGTFRALLMEVDLSYLEGGQVKGRAKETLWYAPSVAQVVKVVRDGRTPDEGLDQIVAELSEYR